MRKIKMWILFLICGITGSLLPMGIVQAQEFQKWDQKIWAKKVETIKTAGIKSESAREALEKSAQKETEEIDKRMNKGLNTCKGIKLNTEFPFLGDCIGFSSSGVNQTNAFAYMIKGLMKLIIAIIMIVSLLMIVAAGVLMTTAGYDKSNYGKGKEMITTVAQALALLGASGVILKLINPNFFL